jgi:RNA-binding protein
MARADGEPLTGKQIRHLRGLGQKLQPVVVVGKAGLTEGIVAATVEALDRRELIKVRLPVGPGPSRKAIAEELSHAAGAVCAGVVGRTALLYRPNAAGPDEQRVHLPEP